MESAREVIDSRDLVKQNLVNIVQNTEKSRVNSDKELLYKSDASSLSQHNEQYTELLKAYVEDFTSNAKNKRENKQELFEIAKGLLFGIPFATIILMFLTLVCLAYGKIDVLETLPGLCSALATLFGTFMIIPKMITKYLFNKKEEKHLAEIIGKIQKYDRDIRGDLK